MDYLETDDPGIVIPLPTGISQAESGTRARIRDAWDIKFGVWESMTLEEFGGRAKFDMAAFYLKRQGLAQDVNVLVATGKDVYAVAITQAGLEYRFLPRGAVLERKLN